MYTLRQRRKISATRNSDKLQHQCARWLIAASVIVLLVDTLLPPCSVGTCTVTTCDKPPPRNSLHIADNEHTDWSFSRFNDPGPRRAGRDIRSPCETCGDNVFLRGNQNCDCRVRTSNDAGQSRAGWPTLDGSPCKKCPGKVRLKNSNGGKIFICENDECDYWVRPKPEFSQYNDPDVVLRDYQEDAAEAIVEALEAGEKKIACCLATGAGKTSVGNAAIARYLHKKQDLDVMWVAPFGVLLAQADRNRQATPGAPPGCQQNDVLGSQKTQPKSGTIRYVSLQKLYRSINGSEQFDSPSVVVWDEYHWGEITLMGDSLQKWAERDNVTLIGLSATPRWHTNFSIVYTCPMRVLAEEGYLAWPRIYSFGNDEEPLSIQHADMKTALDYPRAESAEPGDVVDYYVEKKYVWEKTFFKVRTLLEIEEYTQLLEKEDVKVFSIHYKKTAGERKEILNHFQNCKPPCVLLSVNICAQGVDIPSLNSVFLTHRILGRHTYIQVVGRGARKVSGKSEYNIVEFDPASWKMRSALYLPLRRLYGS